MAACAASWSISSWASAAAPPATRNRRALPRGCFAHGGGQVLIAVIGLAVAAAGVGIGIYGLRRKFAAYLCTAQMSAPARTVVEGLGVAGYLARAVVFCIAGAFLVDAAVSFDRKRRKAQTATAQQVTAPHRRKRGEALSLPARLATVVHGGGRLVRPWTMPHHIHRPAPGRKLTGRCGVLRKLTSRPPAPHRVPCP
jgi:hypothetical protein